MNERKQKYKGKFTPQNPIKYIGDSANIIYRSMWERSVWNTLTSILVWSVGQVKKLSYHTTTAWLKVR